MQSIESADSLTAAVKVAIAELGDEKGHAPLGDVVDIVRSNRPPNADAVHDCIESLRKRGEIYPVGSDIAVTERDAVVTDGGHEVTVDELRNRAAQARVARSEAALERRDLDMAERCHKAAMSYRRRANRMVRGELVTDGGVVESDKPDIMDAVDNALEELSTPDDPWTTRDAVRANVRGQGFPRDTSKRVAENLEDNDSAFCWFGHIVRRKPDVLTATIEQEGEKDIPRTILIGKLNRARQQLATVQETDADSEGETV